MKRIHALTFCLLLVASTAMADDFPRTLAGITIGDSVDNYFDLCDMKMGSAIPDAPFLSEVHIKSDAIPGIRGGSLTYANSTAEHKVVRLKLKFHDRSLDLFEKLLDEYKDKFGEPDQYKGDTFRNVIAWEWDFAEDGERLSVLLMWSREQQLRPGVSIKMTLNSLVDAEYKAFRMRHDRSGKSKGKKTKIKDLEEFIPR